MSVFDYIISVLNWIKYYTNIIKIWLFYPKEKHFKAERSNIYIQQEKKNQTSTIKVITNHRKSEIISSQFIKSK